LVLRVLTVMASAAISLSRTALRALPKIDRTKLLMTHMQITIQTKTTGRVDQFGWLLMPRGPPIHSMFSMKLLTINMKAREIMAR
jgi:hypothetical protein